MLALAGCSGGQNDTGADASVSPQSTVETPSEAPVANSKVAEKLESAPQVKANAEEVVKTEELYNSFEQTLAELEMAQPQAEENDGGSAESAPENKDRFAELSATSQDRVHQIATGSAADEFLAQALEYGLNGWEQKGNSTIVGEPKLTDGEYNGEPAKLLEVCLDSSDVVVKDSAGNVLNDSGASKRSLNIFTLTEVDGTWKISSHEFPNNPDC
ncbi:MULTISPECIES: hypothetical protein [unclassified Rothia (in: high G+C Gram-positive bacteria)]|uniref:hypothetical protein n=1 Tax=unclassified Rothia (in: high G+C Gram-positive bacteria) TaxID=2689056 RepID=UPI0019575354|nr:MULTISPECIES: hypothetical protein [unclassified Rothia (in: high G+C Gram-positive bacteria)]MBM7051379.1 hypothetical protein [Rothia sp. ZJ1223]QRZ61171.1 hypothetical protein JR346_07930 [Rothia sp. ZJ932]